MFDTEKFIYEVEIRPIIYNFTHKDYYNKELKQKSWYEIGNAMFDDWESLDDGEKFDTVVDLMKKWKFVRDAFVRDFKARLLSPNSKKNPTKKKYLFFDEMLFLIPCIKGLKIEALGEDECTVSSLCSRGVTCDIRQSTALKKSINNFPQKTVKTRSMLNRKSQGRSSSQNNQETHSPVLKRIKTEEDEYSDQYGHRSFLSSFVPILCSMPIHEAMLVRQQISEIFSEHFSQHGSY